MEKRSIFRKIKDNMGNSDNMDNQDNMNNKAAMEQTGTPKSADSLDNAVNALISAVLKCEEYLDYRAELDKVLQQPDLKARIDEYRKRNYELQSSMDIDFDKLDRFEKEYENFRSNPLVSDFLEAELAFCKRIQGIETRVTAALDFQ